MNNFQITNLNSQYFEQLNIDGDLIFKLCCTGNIEQIDNCQAWCISKPFIDYVVLQSYTTVVGVLDKGKNVFYEFGKYSRTTSAQVTRFCKWMHCDRVLLKEVA